MTPLYTRLRETWTYAIRLFRWERGESAEWIAVEGAGLPRGFVPRSFAVADHLYGYDGFVAAELVGDRQALVQFAVGPDLELDRPRQVSGEQHFDLVFAGIRRHVEFGIIAAIIVGLIG